MGREREERERERNKKKRKKSKRYIEREGAEREAGCMYRVSLGSVDILVVVLFGPFSGFYKLPVAGSQEKWET